MLQLHIGLVLQRFPPIYELMQRLEMPIELMQTELYAIADRVAEADEIPHLDIWQATFVVESSLPTLLLYLTDGLYLPIDLERTYQYTCDRQRIPGS